VVVDGDSETDSVCLWDSVGGALISSASIASLVPTVSCSNDEQCPLRVTALQWHPARDVLAVGCDDGSIKLRTHTHFQIATGDALTSHTTLIGHDSDILALSWSHSLGSKLASISSDRTLIIWSCLDSCGDFNTQCVKLITRLKYDDFNMTTVSWSADNQRIAVGSSELVFRVWNEVEMAD
jgi:WD40 repeat protein